MFTQQNKLRIVPALLATLLAAACGSSSEPGTTPTGTTPQAAEEARSTKSYDANPHVSDADFASFIGDNNDFGFDLYRQVAPEGTSNVFLSPASVSVALAMTYAGARNQTETQMATAMHFKLPQSALHPAFNKLSLALASRNLAIHSTDEGDKSIKLNMVNSAWAQKGYAFVPEYLDTLAVEHNAGIKLLDYIADADGSRQTINAWVDAKTEHKITELLPDGSIDGSTRLVLTNTLYFYGSWGSAFDRALTKDAVFHAPAGDVTVPTMQAMRWIGYAEGDGWQMFELPYEGNQLGMTVILPTEGRFAEVRGALTSDWLGTATAQMKSFEGEVSVSLPKFRFTWGTQSLKAPLANLGMIDAFAYPAADFSGMEASKELYISNVFHKAFVGVDEDGTEAAAATAVVMNSGATPQVPKVVDVNRPFLFMIRDATGAILFLGQVSDPSKS